MSICFEQIARITGEGVAGYGETGMWAICRKKCLYGMNSTIILRQCGLMTDLGLSFHYQFFGVVAKGGVYNGEIVALLEFAEVDEAGVPVYFAIEDLSSLCVVDFYMEDFERRDDLHMIGCRVRKQFYELVKSVAYAFVISRIVVCSVADVERDGSVPLAVFGAVVMAYGANIDIVVSA